MLGGKRPTVMESVQNIQTPTRISPKVAPAIGKEVIGGEPQPTLLGTVGKLLQQLDEEKEFSTGSSARKANRTKKPVPSFQQGGVVPGYLGQRRLAQVEGGETILNPQQMGSLLGQTGMFGPTYQVQPQRLPEFLTRPRMVSLAELSGGALRPRSLQTIRRQSPTQRMLTLELAKSFGIPAQDFLEEEQMATSVSGGRQMARFTPTTVRSR